MFTDNGVGNKLELVEDEILENLQAVQLRNGLPQTKTLKKGAYDFDIEIETGTGKTYVYLRTIFELNKTYGFKMFIIVVPCIAIKGRGQVPGNYQGTLPDHLQQCDLRLLHLRRQQTGGSALLCGQ